MATIKYVCTIASVDARRYGLATIWLRRADGVSGWLKISGSDPVVQSAEVGQLLLVSIEREDRPEPPPG